MLRVDSESVCAVSTFGIVVKYTVVSTGVRMGIPERGRTAAKRRELHLLLRQTLLHLSFQSINEPAKTCIQLQKATYTFNISFGPEKQNHCRLLIHFVAVTRTLCFCSDVH